MGAKPFFKTRFAIRPGHDSGGDHWLGGKGDYRDADCPICQVPLLLLVDINCKDPVFRKASRGKFDTLKRLPLLVCVRCFCALSYAVDEQQKVEVVRAEEGNPGSEPYPNYPNCLPRKPIALDSSVPSLLPKVIRKWNVKSDMLGENLSKRDRQLLEDFFGHPIFIPRYMHHHQLGGESLYEEWDRDAFPCPNNECPGGLWDNMLKRSRPMKFLAGILNDPPGGLPLIEPLNENTQADWNYCVSFCFQICDKCLTITSTNISD